MRRVPVLVLLWLGALTVLAAPAAADRGPWGWPLSGPREVARPFAPPASAYGAGHRGVDLPSVAGAAVRASAAGRVSYAGLVAGRGVVVVTHGALRTTYEPVTASVDVGQVVALGEVVGRVAPGHLGCPVRACLHWGLRRGEEYLDPVRLVELGPVRLLPMDGSASGGGTTGRTALGTGSTEAGLTGSRAAGRAGPPPGGAAAPSGPAARGEPSWSLRANEAPLGVAAVVALVLGVGLLARPAPPRPRPPATPSEAALAAEALAVPVHAAEVGSPASALPSPDAAPPPDRRPPSTTAGRRPAARGDARGSCGEGGDSGGGDDSGGDPVPPAADVLELAVERARRRPA